MSKRNSFTSCSILLVLISPSWDYGIKSGGGEVLMDLICKAELLVKLSFSLTP